MPKPNLPTKIIRHVADHSQRPVTLHQLTELCLVLARKLDGSVSLEDMESVLHPAIDFLVNANDHLHTVQSLRNDAEAQQFPP
jgi:hypothetical protein